MARLSREHRKLQQVIGYHDELQELDREMADLREMIDDPDGEEELVQLAKAELPELETRFAALKEKILFAMIPPDATDSRNTIVEIRAGAGGDEASLFAGDLCRMYQRYAEVNSWKVEPMSSNPSELGGVQGSVFPGKGRRGLQETALRIGSPPGATGSRYRIVRPHPHLHRDRGHDAGGGAGRHRY